MTQAQVDLIQSSGLYIIRSTPREVTCQLSLSEELKIKNVKGEIKLVFIGERTKISISEETFNKLFNIAESIQLLASFLKGNQNV